MSTSTQSDSPIITSASTASEAAAAAAAAAAASTAKSSSTIAAAPSSPAKLAPNDASFASSAADTSHIDETFSPTTDDDGNTTDELATSSDHASSSTHNVAAVKQAMASWAASNSILQQYRPDENDNTILIKSDTQQYFLLPIPAYNKWVRKLFGFTLNCRCRIYDEVRLTVWILAIVAGIIVASFFIAELDLHDVAPDDVQLHELTLALVIAGIFGFVASLLSFIQIRQHLNNWQHAPSQRCVVRILLMVPVYSISAWLSLFNLRFSIYFDFVRITYEAYVIYTFMMLLTKYLGGHEGVVQFLQFKKPIAWPSPMGFLPPVTPGSGFLRWLKYGTLQYTIIAPVMSLIAVTLNQFDAYGDGEIVWDKGYVYIAFIQNCTQLISLYALVWLYVAMKNELAPFKPVSKFLVVKAVVFFTFWQSVLIAILVHMSVIKDTETLKVGEVQVGLQDLLVCIEMFIAACFHKYTFGYETYANGSMKLLMDQRALQIAQLTYDRAVKQAAYRQEEEKKMRKRKRRMKRLARQAMAEATGVDISAIQIKTNKKKSTKKQPRFNPDGTVRVKKAKKSKLAATSEAVNRIAQQAAQSADRAHGSGGHISIDIDSASSSSHHAPIVLRAASPTVANSSVTRATTTVELNSPLMHQLLSPKSATSQLASDSDASNGGNNGLISMNPHSSAVLFDESRVQYDDDRLETTEELLIKSVRAAMRKQDIEARMRRRAERARVAAASSSGVQASPDRSPLSTSGGGGYNAIPNQELLSPDPLSPLSQTDRQRQNQLMSPDSESHRLDDDDDDDEKEGRQQRQQQHDDQTRIVKPIEQGDATAEEGPEHVQLRYAETNVHVSPPIQPIHSGGTKLLQSNKRRGSQAIDLL